MKSNHLFSRGTVSPARASGLPEIIPPAPPTLLVPHISLRALSIFILLLVKEMANQSILLVVRGTWAEDYQKGCVLDFPAVKRYPMPWVGSAGGRHFGGLIGHSLTEQSSGRNRPSGAYSEESQL